MRILQVIPYFVPAWDYGGPLRVCYELSKQLVKRGHKVTVYTTDALNAKSRITRGEEVMDGIAVKRFQNISNGLAYKHKLFLPPGMFLPMHDLEHFDVIHMHEYHTLQNVMIYYHAKRLKVPYVLQAHGSIPVTGAKQSLKRLFNHLWGYRLLKGAARLIALTPTEAAQYRSTDLSNDRIEIVPNGIDLSEFESLPRRGEFRKKYGLNGREKIVLYVGRIHETKGLDLLARAFVRCSDELRNAKLVLVGPDDGYLVELKKLVARLGIEKQVIFIGPLYADHKWEAYVDADVFVTPSYSGFPTTFVEACACGVPIVTTQKGDALEWIDGHVGYVTTWDEEEMGRAIAKILDDQPLAGQFRKRGQEILVERFDWTKIVEKVGQIYLGCLQPSKQIVM